MIRFMILMMFLATCPWCVNAATLDISVTYRGADGGGAKPAHQGERIVLYEEDWHIARSFIVDKEGHWYGDVPVGAYHILLRPLISDAPLAPRFVGEKHFEVSKDGAEIDLVLQELLPIKWTFTVVAKPDGQPMAELRVRVRQENQTLNFVTSKSGEFNVWGYPGNTLLIDILAQPDRIKNGDIYLGPYTMEKGPTMETTLEVERRTLSLKLHFQALETLPKLPLDKMWRVLVTGDNRVRREVKIQNATAIAYDLPAGTYTAQLLDGYEEYIAAGLDGLAVKDGETLSRGVALATRQMLPLQIKVVDEARSQPLASARVEVRNRRTNQGIKSITDADGCCVLDLTEDRYSVMAVLPNYGLSASVEFEHSGKTPKLELPFKDLKAISGTIRDEQDKPVAGAKLLVNNLDGNGEYRGASDVTGEYTLFHRVRRSGLLHVFAPPHGMICEVLDVASQDVEHDIALRPAVTFSVRIDVAQECAEKIGKRPILLVARPDMPAFPVDRNLLKQGQDHAVRGLSSGTYSLFVGQDGSAEYYHLADVSVSPEGEVSRKAVTVTEDVFAQEPVKYGF